MNAHILNLPAGSFWSRSRLRPNRRKGLTLVELLVVIVVLGVLAGLAVPLIDRARDAALDSTKVKNADILNSLCSTLNQGGVDMTAWASAADAVTALRAGVAIPPVIAGGQPITVQLQKDVNPAAYTFTAALAGTAPRFVAVLGQRDVRP